MFGGLSVLTVALAMRDNDARGLATLLSPAFVLFGAWLLVTVVLSFDPGTSIRRFRLTVCVVAVTAALMLLPKSQQELMRWFTHRGAGACWRSAISEYCWRRDLSIHLATDPQEPGLAGNWRGAFGHKNVAAAIMVMVLFLGIYIIRSGAWISGAAIIALASLFLLYSAGKSSLTLCFAVLLLTSLTSVVRSFWLRADHIADAAVVAEPAERRHRDARRPRRDLRSCCRWIRHSPAAPTSGRLRCSRCMRDCSPATALRPSGAAAPSRTCRKARNGRASPRTATTAISIPRSAWACPGLLLLILVLVIVPLRNFQQADEGGNNGPLAMMLLRIWLFGLYLSAMESFFLDRSDPLWFTFLLAVFGLHYLARFRAQA